MTTTDKQYDEVIHSCKEIFLRKAMDYGTAWRVLRTISIVDQIFIKAQRIRTIQETGKQKVADDISAEFKGIINYALIGLLQLERMRVVHGIVKHGPQARLGFTGYATDDIGAVHLSEVHTQLARDAAGNERLPAARRTVQQHPRGGRHAKVREYLRVDQGVLHQLADVSQQRAHASQVRPVTSKTAESRFDAVSSGPNSRKLCGLRHTGGPRLVADPIVADAGAGIRPTHKRTPARCASHRRYGIHDRARHPLPGQVREAVAVAAESAMLYASTSGLGRRRRFV